ncbi:MAG TPA: hypothetical protein VM490_24835 [Armatimonadaceae bacterium]|jgi:predicted RNase H-like nuclease (RuvC/YqgF family)|nr:hypothetical protein [Armatimonadaceae bacterium]
MTEAEHRAFLDSTEYRDWATLHRRVAAGESLTAEEQARYDAVINRMDADEGQQFATAASRTRAHVEALEAENQRLRAQYEDLYRQVTALEERFEQRGKEPTASGTR